MYLSQLKGTPAIWLKIKRRLSFGFGCDSPNKWLSAVTALARCFSFAIDFQPDLEWGFYNKQSAFTIVSWSGFFNEFLPYLGRFYE